MGSMLSSEIYYIFSEFVEGMPMATSRKKQAPKPSLDAVVGAQIRTLRGRRDFSQAKLADRMRDLGRETSQPVVGRMEGVGGQRSITIADLFAVAAALDVAPAELLAASFEPQLVPNDRRSPGGTA